MSIGAYCQDGHGFYDESCPACREERAKEEVPPMPPMKRGSDERAAIVHWVRKHANLEPGGLLADRIEKGEHLK